MSGKVSTKYAPTIPPTGNVYGRRNPNDKTSYVDQKALKENLEKRKEWVYKNALREDAELWKNRNFRIVRKDLYAGIEDGSLMDISPYKVELYKSFNGNNPSLWQGSQVGMSTRQLYGQQIDNQYQKYRQELAPHKMIPTTRDGYLINDNPLPY